MKLPTHPPLTPDQILALQTGDWIVVVWDGAPQPITLQFEGRDEIPNKTGWVKFADLLDGGSHQVWKADAPKMPAKPPEPVSAVMPRVDPPAAKDPVQRENGASPRESRQHTEPYDGIEFSAPGVQIRVVVDPKKLRTLIMDVMEAITRAHAE